MKIPNFNKPKFKRNDIAYLRLEINGKIEYKICRIRQDFPTQYNSYKYHISLSNKPLEEPPLNQSWLFPSYPESELLTLKESRKLKLDKIIKK